MDPADNPRQVCHQMREKGFAASTVVQRSTQESLHVIKFWQDFGIGTEQRKL
ncbi:hypothetical protein AAG906_002880 [Vitis piasezkii]